MYTHVMLRYRLLFNAMSNVYGVKTKRKYAAAIRTLYFKAYKICPLDNMFNMLTNYIKLINYDRCQDF